VNEQNRLRLARCAERYTRRARRLDDEDPAAFVRRFLELCDRLLRPQMEEVSAELRCSGFASSVHLREDGPEAPAIELSVGLPGCSPRDRNVVGFAVIHWPDEPMQILAYLEAAPPPFDIERFASPEEVGAERVEQLLVDAVEQILAVSR
jgi:hypothetical protein